MGIKSKIKSAASKVKSAATSYVKNVKGGAGIVAGALSSAGKKVGNSGLLGNVGTPVGLGNQSGIAPVSNKKTSTPFNPITGGGNIANAEAGYGANTGLVDSRGNSVVPPKISSKGSGVSIGSRGTSSGTSSRGSVLGASTSNLSADGTSLMNTRSFGPSSSSFSSPSGQTGLGSNASSVPTSTVVNNASLKNVPAITLPEPTVNDYSYDIPGLITPADPKLAETTANDKAQQDYIDALMKEAPSAEDAYAKAQRETGIREKQQVVSDLTGQLNAIVSKGQANQLSLVGQGRGIPEAIIGGQQAQIGRETAIAALPVQAQLSAAQGNLEMANDNLDTLFKIYSDDAKNKYEQRIAVKKAVYDFASAKEKTALEKQAKMEERAYDEQQTVLEDIKSITKTALQGGAPAGVMANIAKSKTYAEAVQAAGKYGGDYLQRELLVQQINNVRSQIAERNNVANSYGTISGKPQNASQSSANGYADRVAEADVIINNLGTKFTSSTSIGGSLPNFLQNNDRQMYEQAKRNFITAILRRESGAAIADSEFITAEKQYFPQRGDGDGVVGQKEISRNTAINNLYRESGVNRPVLPGQIIESNGQRFRVGTDGETLELL